MNVSNRWYFTEDQMANTPSRKCCLSETKELSFRQQAANFIQNLGQCLQVNLLCINNAITYMHRFFMYHSFTEIHWSKLSMAALFLAAKYEDQPRKLEHVIKWGCNLLRNQMVLDVRSEAYKDKELEVKVHEDILICTLGFDLYVEHPHSYVVRICKMVNAGKELGSTSYLLATTSLQVTTMCLMYPPTTVACVCVYLACKWAQWKIDPCSKGKDWFYYTDPSLTCDILEDLANKYLEILEKAPPRYRDKLELKMTGQSSDKKTEGSSSASSTKCNTQEKLFFICETTSSSSYVPPSVPPPQSSSHVPSSSAKLSTSDTQQSSFENSLRRETQISKPKKMEKKESQKPVTQSTVNTHLQVTKNLHHAVPKTKDLQHSNLLPVCVENETRTAKFESESLNNSCLSMPQLPITTTKASKADVPSGQLNMSHDLSVRKDRDSTKSNELILQVNKKPVANLKAPLNSPMLSSLPVTQVSFVQPTTVYPISSQPNGTNEVNQINSATVMNCNDQTVSLPGKEELNSKIKIPVHSAGLPPTHNLTSSYSKPSIISSTSSQLDAIDGSSTNKGKTVNGIQDVLFPEIKACVETEKVHQNTIQIPKTLQHSATGQSISFSTSNQLALPVISFSEGQLNSCTSNSVPLNAFPNIKYIKLPQKALAKLQQQTAVNFNEQTKNSGEAKVLVCSASVNMHHLNKSTYVNSSQKDASGKPREISHQSKAVNGVPLNNTHQLSHLGKLPKNIPSSPLISFQTQALQHPNLLNLHQISNSINSSSQHLNVPNQTNGLLVHQQNSNSALTFKTKMNKPTENHSARHIANVVEHQKADVAPKIKFMLPNSRSSTPVGQHSYKINNSHAVTMSQDKINNLNHSFRAKHGSQNTNHVPKAIVDGLKVKIPKELVKLRYIVPNSAQRLEDPSKTEVPGKENGTKISNLPKLVIAKDRSGGYVTTPKSDRDEGQKRMHSDSTFDNRSNTLYGVRPAKLQKLDHSSQAKPSHQDSADKTNIQLKVN